VIVLEDIEFEVLELLVTERAAVMSGNRLFYA
jgi:hypothetical protein